MIVSPNLAFSKQEGPKLPAEFSLEFDREYILPIKEFKYGGMVWADDKLYLGTDNGVVYELTFNDGFELTSTSNFGMLQISGMGWDANNLWIITMGSGQILRLGKISGKLAVDNVFKPPYPDTYPYAMAFIGKRLVTSGYQKVIQEYTLTNEDTLVQVDEIYIGTTLQTLTAVDGRLFSIGKRGIVELTDKLRKTHKVNDKGQLGKLLAYDGKSFWTCDGKRIVRFKTKSAEPKTKKIPTVITDEQLKLTAYEYEYARPISVAWDGNNLWSVTQADYIKHTNDGNLSISEAPDIIYPSHSGGLPRLQITHGNGNLAWDGASLVTTGTIKKEFGSQINVLIRLTLVINAGVPMLKMLKEEELPVSGHVSGITWFQDHLWISTGQQTATSGEGSYIHKLAKDEDGNWMVIKTNRYQGKRCQGLAWDGQFLWSYGIFENTLYKHRLDDNLSIDSRYMFINGEPLTYFSGLAWDGHELWAANYNHNKIYKITTLTESGDKVGSEYGHHNKNQAAKDVILPPSLSFEADIAYSNSDATLNYGDSFTITVTVRNFGEGTAEGIDVELTGDKSTLSLFKDKKINLGVISPDRAEQAVFVGTVPDNFDGNKLSVDAKITERYGFEPVASYKIEKPIFPKSNGKGELI
jgi:hypothetical protein